MAPRRTRSVPAHVKTRSNYTLFVIVLTMNDTQLGPLYSVYGNIIMINISFKFIFPAVTQLLL